MPLLVSLPWPQAAAGLGRREEGLVVVEVLREPGVLVVAKAVSAPGGGKSAPCVTFPLASFGDGGMVDPGRSEPFLVY